MRRSVVLGVIVLGAIAALAFTTRPVCAAEAAAKPQADDHGALAAEAHARCSVCVVLHGEAEDEPVRATRVHEGKSYGFCSEKCAQAFTDDPLAYLPPVLPRPAPEFALKTLAGKPVSVAALRGQVVLVDFWATWCAPCRKSMPELQGLHERFGAKGFSVLGVSIDERADAKVRKFVAQMKVGYPIAIDGGPAPAWQSYRVKSVPAAFLLDRTGQVVAQWTGRAPAGDELVRAIETALAARGTATD